MPGSRQDGILIAYLDFGKLGVPEDRRVAFRREIMDRVRASPGVDAASEAQFLMADGSESNRIWIDGDGPQRGIGSRFNYVGTDYFKTLGVPFVAGRDFDERDTAGSPKVIIVNEAFVRALNLGPDAVGKRLRRESQPNSPEETFEIAGVVKNTKYFNIRDDFRPIGYYARAQARRPDSGDQFVIHSTFAAGHIDRIGAAHLQRDESADEFRIHGVQNPHRRRSIAGAPDGDAFGILRGAGGGACRGRTVRRHVVHGGTAA